MPKKKQEEMNDDEGIEALKDLGKTFGPMILEYQKVNAPLLKRAQNINFIIMFVLCVGVFGLAFTRAIDGSAATGLIGAVIGYVFGHIYSRGDKR
jgi:hypothetical protein